MIKARNNITWANQYVAHRDVKRIRRDADKEIEFGVETYRELYGMDLATYRYLMNTKDLATQERWRKLELQWADLEWEDWLFNNGRSK